MTGFGRTLPTWAAGESAAIRATVMNANVVATADRDRTIVKAKFDEVGRRQAIPASQFNGFYSTDPVQ
jgi:hypothetical protein